MNKTLTQAIIILALLTAITGLQAQVTIGSSQPPMKGALLDLTEGAVTTKGLNLPRVELTVLNPSTDIELASSIGDWTSWSMNDHIGLLVYNIKENACAHPNPIYKGIYVWTGTEWQIIGGEPNSPEVKILKDDRDPSNVQYYKYRTFGGAGDWMLENMRATTYVQSTTPPVLSASAQSAPYDRKQYCYPARSAEDGLDDQWFKAYPQVGLLYSWAAALNVGSNIDEMPNIGNVNEGQGEVGEQSVIRQGICPTGWHIPSDREWNELEREIYQHAEKYSKYTLAEATDMNTTTPWNVAWETSATYRPSNTSTIAHGRAMLSSCAPFGDSRITDGLSLSSSRGGFDAPPAGLVYNNYEITAGYGDQANFWSASAYDSDKVWNRYFYAYHFYSAAYVVRDYSLFGGRYNMVSVRCKKD